MSATLRVTHELGFGVELRRGRFEVLVDGKTLGAVESHETLEAALESGSHTIQVRKGRYSSRDDSIEVVDGEVVDGEVVNYSCHGVRIWPMYVASIVLPNLAITQARVAEAQCLSAGRRPLCESGWLHRDGDARSTTESEIGEYAAD
jgi:hypothetical protein